MAGDAGARLLDWLDARSAEAVAIVGTAVLLLGVAVVADDRQATDDNLQGAASAPAVSSTPEPSEAAVRLAAPPVPGAPATGQPTPEPSPSSSTSSTSNATAPEPAAAVADRRVVVLAVDAPTTVRAGEAVTFTVSVRAVGGTPVLSGARFGDGDDGGVPAPCSGVAGPSYTGDLQVTHTYAVAGTYAPYFVATIPCGPASGAGTSVTVTPGAPGAPEPTASPTPTPMTTPTPTPAPTGTPPVTAKPTP